jgi:hypothetical protein
MKDFRNICSNIYFTEIRTDYNYFEFSPTPTLILHRFLPVKVIFRGRALKSVACVTRVRKAADEIIVTLFKIIRCKGNK